MTTTDTKATTTRTAIWRAAPSSAAGNWFAAVGTVVYFLEWVAITGAGGISVLFEPGTAQSTVFHAYAGHSNAYAWASGWSCVVLLGRVVFAIGVRRSLPRDDTSDALAELGVLAMLAGAIFEISSYAVVMAAAVVADNAGSRSTVVALDSVAMSLNNLLWGATGVSVLVLSWAMVRTTAFPKLLSILGLVAGAVLVVDALGLNAPEFFGLHQGLTIVALLMWIWMIWSSILIVNRRPRRGAAVA